VTHHRIEQSRGIWGSRFNSKQIAILFFYLPVIIFEAWMLRPPKRKVGRARGTNLRILLNCIILACAAAVLMISHAERQQEAALDALSNYKLKPQPVVYDDPDLKLITARSPDVRDE
jgi:hypothetical protein